MKKVLFVAMFFGEAAFSPLLGEGSVRGVTIPTGTLLEEIAARDKAADDAVAAIRTPEELKAKQAAWRAYWLDALGEMPARTPPCGAPSKTTTGPISCGKRLQEERLCVSVS